MNEGTLSCNYYDGRCCSNFTECFYDTSRSISFLHKSCLYVHKIIGQEKPLTYGWQPNNHQTPSSDNWYQNLRLFPLTDLLSLAFQWRFMAQETVKLLLKAKGGFFESRLLYQDSLMVFCSMSGNYFLACCKHSLFFPRVPYRFLFFILNLLCFFVVCSSK